ncbi:hypothetical protein GCM10022381_34470 [Leifsonia kafniensis]|uniref:LytR/CpsA/Psr regulator C-terminal domain-containing protein n=1 Tax=Leifsonia kafniensis TaxID=475957 RepID=A0ABP7KZG4_9MICO
MPRNTPNDRFDSLPHSVDRVGAHRGPAKKGRGWIVLAWAFGATVLLVGAGVAVLFLQNDKLNFSAPGAASSAAPAASATPTATPEPTETAAAEPPAETTAPVPEATVDPSLSVTVLNGTPGTGVAAAVGETLTAAGWTVDDTGDADSEDVATTIVYYSDAALEPAARGVLASLPGAETRLSDEFSGNGASLTVVVGNDYAG